MPSGKQDSLVAAIREPNWNAHSDMTTRQKCGLRCVCTSSGMSRPSVSQHNDTWVMPAHEEAFNTRSRAVPTLIKQTSSNAEPNTKHTALSSWIHRQLPNKMPHLNNGGRQMKAGRKTCTSERQYNDISQALDEHIYTYNVTSLIFRNSLDTVCHRYF